MTAIFGLWRFDGGEVAADIRRMDVALSRFGQDGHEIWSPAPDIALGRHLHASLAEDCFGSPLHIGHRYVVAGDVRLSERDDLARELGLSGDATRMSDAAIAAAAVEKWHEGAFDRIYGAFAIAAWDTEERRLLLGRDHVGQKPLFFHLAENFLAFASMPDGLQALPEFPLAADMESMKRFLALENRAPSKTHFEGIERVAPGHYSTVRSGEVRHKRYWNPDLTPLRLASHEDYVNALSDRLNQAVAAALRGVEAQVGAHLSSGFDSTAVATTAARQLASRGGTVVAYTAAPREGFDSAVPDRIADESQLAAKTAAMHPNMEHVVIRSGRTPLANLRRSASIYGEPVLNICNDSWYDAINDDAAARGITVLLEGVLGNASISESGILALPELLRRGEVVSWFKLSANCVRKGTIGLPRILWNSFSSAIPNRLYRWLIERRYGSLVSPSRYSALKEEHLSEALLAAAEESSYAEADHRILSSGWARPTQNSLQDRLLLIAADDRGACSKGMLGQWKIDYRDPTADRRLIEFSLSVPTEELIHDGEPRALLRNVLSDRVPPEVLANRRRGYQGADWHEWLDRDEIAAEVERIEMFEPTAELIDVERLKILIENWPEKRSESWDSFSTIVDYRCCLLRAISAASFMRQAARSNH